MRLEPLLRAPCTKPGSLLVSQICHAILAYRGIVYIGSSFVAIVAMTMKLCSRNTNYNATKGVFNDAIFHCNGNQVGYLCARCALFDVWPVQMYSTNPTSSDFMRCWRARLRRSCRGTEITFLHGSEKVSWFHSKA